MYFVFLAAPAIMEATAWIGLATALLAASMALVSYDIKRVLAFSTVSQLGFMMCGLGAGGFTAGLFHLTTHAFFKALLFLGAGSVIHATHTNDMRQMGGLSKKMPLTFVTMLIAVLAIAGLPPFAGFYSKDMILAAVWRHDHRMFWLLLGAALLTAFYMTRLFLLTFWGDDRDHERYQHAHESSELMTLPLLILAVFSAFAGLGLAHGGFIRKALRPPTIAAAPGAAPAPALAAAVPAAPAEHAEAAAPSAAAEAEEPELPSRLKTAVPLFVLLSMLFAYVLYRGPGFATAAAIRSAAGPLTTLLDRRWYFDDAFYALAAFSDRVAALAFWIDANVVDRVFVDGWGLLMRIGSELSRLFDDVFVDSAVDGVGGLGNDLGTGLRALVSDGQVQEYLLYAAVAFALAATLILAR